MLQQNHFLPDTYFLESFIGSLKTTVKHFVRAFKPQTVTAVIEYARCQEGSLEANKNSSKNYVAVKPSFPNAYQNSLKPHTSFPAPQNALNTSNPFPRP